jgi:hypothetical protein
VFFAIKESRTADAQFSKDIASCRTKFQLYCFSNEVEEFENLCSTIESKNDLEAYNVALRKVIRLVTSQVREQLGLDEYMYKQIDA